MIKYIIFTLSLLLISIINSYSQRPSCGIEIDSLIKKGSDRIYSNTDSSFQYFQEASNIALNCRDSFGIAKVTNYLGLYHYLKNNYDLASEFYFKALRLSERNKFIKDEGIVNNNLGSLFFDLEEYQKSKKYYERSLDIMSKLQDSIWIARIYGNLAGVYFMNQEYQKSIETLNKSVDLGIKTKNFVVIGSALSNLAMVHMTLNDTEAAFEAYDRGAYLLDSVGDKRGVCIVLQEKADALVTHKRYSLATETYEQVLKRAYKISHKESIMKSYKGLFDIQESFGNSTQALAYHKKYTQWKDSLLNEEKVKSINELNEKYQTEKKEKEIIYLTSEAKLKDALVQKKQKEKNYLVLTVSLFFLVIILIVAQLRQKQRLNNQLIDKNSIIKSALKDREILIKEVHHRVKNNLQIVSSMLNIQANSIPDGKVKEAILESRKRVQSMSIVHQKLYKSDKIGSINIKEYIQYILDEVENFYEFDSEAEINIKTEIEESELSIDTTIPLGLIITELVSNAYKHAFKNKKEGEISVSLKSEKGKYDLVVSDNGAGLGTNSFDKSESFGIKLIKALSKGLSAEPIWKNKNGTKVNLTFSV